MADIRAVCIGNFASVSSFGLFPVAVEDVQDTAAVRGLHIVLIRCPDWPTVFPPAHTHSLTTGERYSKI